MKLIIAEKPSLGRSVADEIGVIQDHKDKGYIECKGGFCVTWVFGHIIEMVKPEAYNPDYKYFRMSNLPIIPINWKYQPTPSAITQYNNIKKLMDQATLIINCGDPDREGQLLIDELLIQFGNTKPVKRLLILDPKPAGIRKSLDNMEDNSKYYSWYQAGLLRTQADWLIGYNFTPAFTILGKKQLGIEGVISIGRVQTPTLKLIYDRDKAIKNYKPLNYYNLYARFKTNTSQEFSAKLDYTGLNLSLDSEGRLLDHNPIATIAKTIANQQGVISNYEVKDCETAQPLPFKLSDLQARVNAKLGLSADDVLKIAQTLYEKQLATYPRTACAYLPESLHVDARNVLAALTDIYPNEVSKANPTIKSRAFNDKQLGGESHFAIIPTGEKTALATLKPLELEVYKIIALQYIAQFYPTIKYQETNGTVSCMNYNFNFNGKVINDTGWKQLFMSSTNSDDEEESANDEDTQALPPLTLNQSVAHSGDEIKKSTTTKPKPYTEGTLIKAMANIHNELNNIVKTYYTNETEAQVMIEKYKKVLKDTAGLGTEATRASTIDKLKERDYVTLVKKNLIITEKGISVMELLTKDTNLSDYSVLTSPLTTAIYEQQLDDVLNHKLTPDKFIQDVHNMINDKVVQLKAFDATMPEKKALVTGNKCPQCQSDMVMKSGKFGEFEACSNYPACKYIVKKEKTKQLTTTGEKCPQCQSDIIERDGQYGKWKSCSGYPKCKWTPPHAEKPKAELAGKKCDKCGKEMVKRKSKDGTKEFLACSGYPECKNVEWL